MKTSIRQSVHTLSSRKRAVVSMKIVEFTRVVPETLWAARFEGNDENEFDRTFNCWDNPEYLDAFFTEHEHDLDVLVRFLKELNIETVEDWGYIDFE